jgi:hypothetical protein
MAITEEQKNETLVNTVEVKKPMSEAQKNTIIGLSLIACGIIGYIICFFYIGNAISKNIETIALASLYGYWHIVENKYCLIDEESMTYITIVPNSLVVDSVSTFKTIKSNKKSNLDGNYKFDIIFEKKDEYFKSETLSIDINYVIGESLFTVGGTIVDTMIKDSEMSIRHHSA